MTVTSAPEVSFRSADRFFIGGEWVRPSSEAHFVVINPTDERPLFTIAEAKADDMAKAISAAREAFDRGPWPRLAHRSERGISASLRTDTRPRDRPRHHAHRPDGSPSATTARMMIPRSAATYECLRGTGGDVPVRRAP